MGGGASRPPGWGSPDHTFGQAHDPHPPNTHSAFFSLLQPPLVVLERPPEPQSSFVLQHVPKPPEVLAQEPPLLPQFPLFFLILLGVRPPQLLLVPFRHFRDALRQRLFIGFRHRLIAHPHLDPPSATRRMISHLGMNDPDDHMRLVVVIQPVPTVRIHHLQFDVCRRGMRMQVPKTVFLSKHSFTHHSEDKHDTTL